MPDTTTLGGAIPAPTPTSRRFDLAAAVREADREHGLFDPDSTVVVGVSGGGDSVALLYAMHAYAAEARVGLHVVHIDHLIRPESADEAVHVAKLAEELGIECTLSARDVPSLSRESGRGLEESARVARYDELAMVSARVGADVVAVAHTSDDQAETVLMNLLRGSGIDGLRAMRPRSPFPLTCSHRSGDAPAQPRDATDGCSPRWLVRPILHVTRAQARDYLSMLGHTWCEDASNDDQRLLRSRIRHEILPLLEEVNPRVRDALVRLSAAATAELDVLDSLADDALRALRTASEGAFSLNLAAFRRKPIAVRRRVVRRAVSSVRGSAADLGWDHVAAVIRLVDEGTVGRAVSLPGGIRASLGYETLDFAKLVDRIPPASLSTDPRPIAIPGVTRLPGNWTVEAAVLESGKDKPAARPGRWTAFFDASASVPQLALRARKAGDRMQPTGMAGRHKSLQDLFVDAKVPRELRDGWPVVVRGDTVLWVPGIRVSERAAVPAGATKVLRLTVLAPPTVPPMPRQTG